MLSVIDERATHCKEGNDLLNGKLGTTGIYSQNQAIPSLTD